MARMRQILATAIIVFYLVSVAPLFGNNLGDIDTTGFQALLNDVLRNHPTAIMRNEAVKKYEEEVFLTKLSFLSSFKIGFQFNSRTTPELESTIGVVPDFGFNIMLDLGSIISTPSKTKQAKYDLASIKQEYLLTLRELEHSLFERFTRYKKSLSSYQIQLEKFRAIEKTHDMAKQQFAHGEIPLDQYADSIETQAKAKEELLIAELELKEARAALRELTGK